MSDDTVTTEPEQDEPIAKPGIVWIPAEPEDPARLYAFTNGCFPSGRLNLGEP